mmetsp:Transcript_49319/g.121021  ORF Transcript_49319/g.121021 Transcript_49319/m.121021 type:complete len:224 (-) Transcript_49319:305-976(-)
MQVAVYGVRVGQQLCQAPNPHQLNPGQNPLHGKLARRGFPRRPPRVAHRRLRNLANALNRKGSLRVQVQSGAGTQPTTPLWQLSVDSQTERKLRLADTRRAKHFRRTSPRHPATQRLVQPFHKGRHRVALRPLAVQRSGHILNLKLTHCESQAPRCWRATRWPCRWGPWRSGGGWRRARRRRRGGRAGWRSCGKSWRQRTGRWRGSGREPMPTRCRRSRPGSR